MLPRSVTCCRAPMVPRAAERYVVLACVSAHLPWSRLVLRAAALRSFVAAQCYVLPRPMVPRSSTCYRDPCCRAPMVPRAAERYVVLACVGAHLPWWRLVLRAAALRSFVAAQCYVLPRPMVPRSSTCCRDPCCRALMVPRAAERFIVYVWPRTYTRCRAVLRAAPLHGAARGTTLRVFALAAAQWAGLL